METANPKDLEIFSSFINADRQGQSAGKTPGDALLRAGRYFLGAPYEAGTLEETGPEGLIINLRAFDCFTLVESCCALAVMHRDGKNSFSDYAAILQSLRYREGVINGYPSRLHYFSDWLQNNGKGGLILEMTRFLGGRLFRKDLCFMTTHADFYPPLQDPAVRRQMTAIEGRLSATPRYLLSKEEIGIGEAGIESGDILAITTDQEGLDVCHVGIAFRREERLHLLHASQQAGKVVVSPETLADYLHQSPLRTGIMAARLSLPRGYSRKTTVRPNAGETCLSPRPFLMCFSGREKIIT